MTNYANEHGKDIDERLNDIIFKYHLDDVYPDYRKMLQAENVAEELAKQWIGKGKIACIVTYQSDIHHWKHFLREGQQVEFIRCTRKFPWDSNYDKVYDVEKKLGEQNWDEYTEVYILSLEGSSFIKHWLRMHNVPHVFLYDYFALHGLYFSKDWDTLLSDASMEYWTYREGLIPKQNNIIPEIIEIIEVWKSTDIQDFKKLNWKKAFFLALYIRDFSLAEQLVRERPICCNQEIRAWEEISSLVDEIKETIRRQTRKDILVLWTDAVPYADIDKISFLKKKMEKGICFDNIFAVCPNTNPTSKALFCNKLPVDDDSYSIKSISFNNSIVLQELKYSNYKPVVIGGFWAAIQSQEKSKQYHKEYGPVSFRLWDLWRNILKQTKSCFLLVHSILESHSPFLSSCVDDRSINNDYLRYSCSCTYLDRQYQFYLECLPKNLVKIYMTDHGKTEFWKRFHTYMVIENGESARHVKEMCSLVDFYKILQQLLNGQNINEKEFAKDYVKVQDLDYYNPLADARRIKYRIGFEIHFFGYRGIIDKKYIYLKFTNGIEWLAKRGIYNSEPDLFNEHIADVSKLGEYRKKLGEIPEDPPAIKKKLRYANYLHKVYERAKKHNLEKYRVLNDWIGQYSLGSLAIRTGGVAAFNFYEFLSEENKKRIQCFIDLNPNCMAKQLGKPIIRDVYSLPKQITGVLLVSYGLLDILQKEAINYPNALTVLNPYEYLNSQGIVCQSSVADFEVTEEDCDVNFPFHEIDDVI